MRKILQKSLLWLIPLLVAIYTYAALATTITRPYSSSDYAGGTKAVGAKVNAEFQNIVSWLNGGNISSDNIATSGVATANIASFAVTTAKILDANVTLAKLESSHISVTSSSSLYQTLSEVPATVTNLSTTFTPSGRPITVALEPVAATYQNGGITRYDGFVSGGNIASGNGNDAIFFVRDSSTTAHWQFLPVSLGGGAWARQTYPCAAFRYTETGLTSGVSYTFALKASTGLSGSVSTVTVANCRLVVREW